ncbi:MAG: NAD(P)H-dependent oxidoreductase [Hyphomonadaceae bacterium]|nr:NAD(P)H-dependent oxidoreductase [Hyphomonadaceae bacterium]
MPRTVAVLVGSLRTDSLNRKVANALVAEAPQLQFRFAAIGDLPFFNQDLEATPPAQWTRFRDEVRAADAVLWVTPEYNRSVPGVLKNALDVGSRPYGQSVFNGKPAAVISASMGAIGGFGANHHLRQSLAFLNMPTLPSEAYIGAAHTLFDESGKLKNEDTRKFLTGFAQAFAAWVEKHAA